MESAKHFETLTAKIHELGESKRNAINALAKVNDELASVYKINKGLQAQIEELTVKIEELEATQSLRNETQIDHVHSTKQRINALVKEIDECLLLLNK
jgi:predicted  nucleic acid-binding Zn-ribbon protein